MKNSWRVILTFSQNSLGKQFRNDLMMLRGYCTPSKKTKTKQNKTKQNKTKQNKNKQKQKNKHKTKTKHTQAYTKKHVLCSIPKLISTPFWEKNIYASQAYSKLSVQGTQKQHQNLSRPSGS